jgi:hypothetical protein
MVESLRQIESRCKQPLGSKTTHCVPSDGVFDGSQVAEEQNQM